MDKALELADYAGFPARRRASEAKGKLRGVGFSAYIEAAASPLRRWWDRSVRA